MTTTDTTSAPAPGGPAAGSVLSVRGLRKDFTLHTIDGRVVDALHGVDLDVAPGEHVALAGTSGAGKSTLLRCVYRTYLSGGGNIWFRTAHGETVDIAALPDSDVADLRGKEIGYVSQFLRPQPRRSVLDIVTASVDSLSSDYMPTTLLAAALHLAHQGVLPLAGAVHLVTAGAALTAGLGDRGALRPGLRADLIAVTGDHTQQTVRMTLLAEESRDGGRLPGSPLLAAQGW